MLCIRHHIRTLRVALSRASTHRELLRKLERIGIKPSSPDTSMRRIVIDCDYLALDLLVWRCWADKMMLELQPVKEDVTLIKIFAIPNLLRIRPPATPINCSVLLSALSQDWPGETTPDANRP